jgi:uncharacterized protein
MKLSRYNRFIALDKSVLGFNCVSCGFAEFDKDTYDLLKSLDGNGNAKVNMAFPENYLQELQRGKFVVDDDVNEVDALKQLYNSTRYNTSGFGLTIAPTMGCNFRCTYCYEGDLKPVKMSREVQDAIIGFLTTRIETLKRVGISWYGGEPLLATDVIYRLSDKLIDLCQKNECRYQASMVTNGWFLTRKTAERLKEYQIKRVQVTLDGPPKIHNVRRPLKGGQKTFDRILANIEAVADVLNVAIRINTDTTNIDHVLELYEILHERKLIGKVHPYLGQVAAHTEACADIEPDCFSTKDFSTVELQLFKELKLRGIPADMSYPRMLSVFCGATMWNSYVVDPLGNLFKCWHHLGNENDYVGNITDLGNELENNPRFLKWMAFDPFAIIECRECETLPICSGGCPEYYYNDKHLDQPNSSNCVSWRYRLDDTLREYYESWKGQKLLQQEKHSAMEGK